MPSYYEVLKLDSNASVEVIEAAIDDQYNQFRRLINHHDPNVVEQANRALRQLEDIRSTLTNPEKRVLYDQTLIGGLVDPNAILQSMSVGTAMMTPPPPQTASQDDPRVYAWKCSQCGTANLLGSTSCSNCGNILARDCPNGCGSVVRLSEKYCSKCGKSVEEGLAKMQLEFERAQKSMVEGLRTEIQLKRGELDQLGKFIHRVPLYDKELETLVGHIDVSLSGTGYVLWLIGIVAGLWIGSLLRPDGGAIIGGFIGLLVVPHIVQRVEAVPRVRDVIESAIQQRQEDIRHAERRLQEEQAKKFDPLSPEPYSPTPS